MNPDIKAQWLAALRSGEYKQGTGRLRNGDSFCCLGVLCDLAVKQGIGEWMRNSEGIAISGDYQELTLPDSVATWAGLNYRNPKVGEVYDDDFQYTVADFNDGVLPSDAVNEERLRPHTFTEIADLIETYL